ncbi:MAG: tyrosine-type recombinase/integrase [Flavobacteriales bacterium]|nr:tyrosine-type recombinase/integrase [Flavobacteriales bacterium]
MSKIRYNLRNTKSQNETSIILIFNFDGERLKVSTNISIHPKFWNRQKQRIKEQMDSPAHYSLNQRLDELSLIMTKEYNKLLETDGVADKDVLKHNFLKAINSPTTNGKKKKFWDYYEEFVEFKRKQLNDIRDYNKSLRKHLLATEKILKNKATFNSIKMLDNGFIETMENYLTYEAINAYGERGLSVNTIGKQFKNIKVFLNWCFEREYVPIFSTKHIISRQEITDEVYITQEELDQMLALKINDDLQQKIRDAFILGCETGLRFGDLKSFRNAHIDKTNRKESIKIQQKKTKKKVIIPLSRVALSILKKYNYNSPIQKITSANFNREIKQICKNTGIDNTVTQYRTLKGAIQEIDYKKYKLVSSHTCRRTFCTLKVLAEIPISLIMKISGHNTEKSFFRYLKMDEETSAEKMRKYIN